MYVAYHMTSDSTPFGGEGVIKYVYFFILITHILLSIVIIPFVLITFMRARLGNFPEHKKIAKITYADGYPQGVAQVGNRNGLLMTLVTDLGQMRAIVAFCGQRPQLRIDSAILLRNVSASIRMHTGPTSCKPAQATVTT